MRSIYFLLLVAILLSACGEPPMLQPTATTQTTLESTQPILATDTNEPEATVESSATHEPALTAESTATLEPLITPTSEPELETIAFIDKAGNVRLIDRLGGDLHHVTTDAALPSPQGGETTIQYWDLIASSDGEMLAFRRDVGTPNQDGYTYVFEIWVYDLSTREPRSLLLNQLTAGMDWKPGTHLLTYAVAPEQDYFTPPGTDASKARGIRAVDADSGENIELVAPENGYSLSRPMWSPDGRYLAFEEIWNMEGSGYFAFYDFETREYKSFDEAIGLTDWSPDSQTVAYDRLTYIATGSEQIFMRPIAGGEDQQVAPDYAEGYTYSPHFSPSGTQIAYLFHRGSLDDMTSTLQVQLFDMQGEVINLGDFENPLYINWLPDESGLVLAVGPYDSRQVIEVSLPDGTVTVLADGDSPAVLP